MPVAGSTSVIDAVHDVTDSAAFTAPTAPNRMSLESVVVTAGDVTDLEVVGLSFLTLTSISLDAPASSNAQIPWAIPDVPAVISMMLNGSPDATFFSATHSEFAFAAPSAFVLLTVHPDDPPGSLSFTVGATSEADCDRNANTLFPAVVVDPILSDADAPAPVALDWTTVIAIYFTASRNSVQIKPFGVPAPPEHFRVIRSSFAKVFVEAIRFVDFSAFASVTL